jgi:predicted O-linked N-acetylglucosamine transferase (SPINDLY family)
MTIKDFIKLNTIDFINQQKEQSDLIYNEETDTPLERLRNLDFLLKLDPSNLKYQVSMKEIVIKEKQLRYIKDLVVNYPNDYETNILYCRLLIANGVKNEQLILEYLNRTLALSTHSAERVEVYKLYGDYYTSTTNRTLAILFFKKAFEISPTDIHILNSLAVNLVLQGFLEEALTYSNSLIMYASKNPATLPQQLSSFYQNRGLIYEQMNDYVEANKDYQIALKHNKDNYYVVQNQLLNNLYDPDMTAEGLLEASMKMNEFVSPFKTTSKGSKIAVLSGDFVNHPCQYFIKKLLDTRQDIIIITNDTIEDGLYKNKIVSIKDKNTADSIKLIQAEDIDILIDISIYTNKNRFDVIREKPVRVIINYLGYPASSGCNAYDYIICDENTKSLSSEKQLCFPKSHLLFEYSHMKDMVIKRKLRECLTFGFFNRFQKLNSQTLRLYKRLLDEYKDSKIIFKNKSFFNERNRAFVLKHLPADRIEFVEHHNNRLEHFDFHNEIDVMLDTIPYNGTTTTCESLYCGVPVLTMKHKGYLRVQSSHSRMSESILKNSGLEEWCADNEKEFIEKAGQFYVKEDIREKFINGYVCNEDVFVSDFEKLFLV